MPFQAQHHVAAPRELVWEWHSRPGALARLTPPFLPMVPLRQAERLSDGTTILGLPAGLKWISKHDLSKYQRGYSFSDVCINAPMKKLSQWRHTHLFEDSPTTAGHTLITDVVDTRLPAAALESLFAYRQRQLIEDFDFLGRMHSINGAARPLTVAVTGSRGGVGRALCAQLTTAGHTVIQLVRSTPKAGLKPGQRLWNPLHPHPQLLDGVDAVVHLAGEPIFGRFNEEHKQEIRNSRVAPTAALAALAAESPTVTSFVSASAIGFYGAARGNEVLTEHSEPGDGFLADVVKHWEAATAPVEEAGKRVVNVRTGAVISGNSGLLPVLKALFHTGLGGPFGNGEFWFSWIALDDLSDIYFRAIVDQELNGPINAVAPHPVLNKTMVQHLASQLRRPALIPIPTLGPALLLGKEGAQELALADQRVDPQLLRNAGHHFRYPTLDMALAHELGGEKLVSLSNS